MTSNLATTPPLTCSFAPQASLVVQKDFGINVNSVANGSTLALNSVVEGFTNTPEPSSVALIVPALFALGWASRRHARG
jgi:hypothetical protein